VKSEPLKILLVDDTPENLVALEALLRRPDVQVITARSGSEALELCLTHELSLALLDVQMPEMDGFELAELMRGAERTKRVPIIFVTAAARDKERMFRGYESGAVDFLYKPIDPLVLTGKVGIFLELAQQRRELAEVLRLNELFVGIVGHDLRNPLAAMMAGTDLLGLSLHEPQHVRALERIRSSGKRMQTMIDELLDLTHARLAPGLGLARARVGIDLRQLLGRAIEEFRVAHDRELVLECSVPCNTVGDPDRLFQLFSNLLANAIAHGRAGSPITTHISTRANTVVVTVHNAGAIPQDRKDTLFVPFKRPRDAQGGLGLGLYIARQIAKAHGGDIDVVSSEDAGTTFTVTLPG
jgi:signal transduction histidine kinase